MKISTLLVSLFILPLFLFAKESINIDQISQQQLKPQNKHSILFFHMDRCPYCKKLKKNALSDNVVQDKLKKDFVFLDVNMDSQSIIKYKEFLGSAKDFCKHLSIGYYPTVVFIDGDNEIVYIMKGYRKTETFNHILDYVTNKYYEKSDFAGYLFDIDVE
jgi:thioredoxin-related protein